MDKKNVAAMSLIAAIPAAIMLAIAVLAFLQHADTMPGLLQVVTGLVLLICAFLALAPLGIFLQIPFLRMGYTTGPSIAKPKKEKAAGLSRKEKKAAAQAEKAAAKAAKKGTAVSDNEAEDLDDELAIDESGEFDEAGSSADLTDEASDEFEFDDSLSDDDFDLSFDDDDKR